MPNDQLSLVLHAALAVVLLVVVAVLLLFYRGDPFLPTLFTGVLGVLGIVVGYFFGKAT